MATDTGKSLKQMLDVAGLAVKPSYNCAEVCLILGISPTTFRRMCKEYEEIDGKPKTGVIDSYIARGSLRVRYHELTRYLSDNNTYKIEMSAPPEQASLFDI